jgi:hypothetical protein
MIVAAITIVAVAVTTVTVNVVMLALPFSPCLKSSGIWIHTLGVPGKWSASLPHHAQSGHDDIGRIIL